MKRAGLPAMIAMLFGCAAMLGAQSSSNTQSGSDQNRPPASAGEQGETSRQPPARTTGAARSQAARNDNQQIVVTGCLMSNDQSGAIGTGGAGASATTATSSGTQSRPARAQTGVAASAYMLTNAAPSSGGAVSSPGATSSAGAGVTSTTPAAASGSSSYMLQGSSLSGHVGQRVEVTGTLLPEPKTRTRRSTAGTAGSTADTTNAPRVRVTSVRMVSASCSGSTSGDTTNR